MLLRARFGFSSFDPTAEISKHLAYPETMTTTTANKQASPSAPSPPRSLQDDSNINESKRHADLAVEKDTSEIVVRETVERDIDDPVLKPEHDPASKPDSDLARETPMAEGQKDDETGDSHSNSDSDDSDDSDDSYAESSRGPTAKETILMTHLLEQNKFLIEHLAEQNKTLLDRFSSPIVLCGAEGQPPSKSKKDKTGAKKSGAKKSSSSITNADVVVRRILRIASVIMLVVIAMQLGSMRGTDYDRHDVAGKNGRRLGGLFGR